MLRRLTLLVILVCLVFTASPNSPKAALAQTPPATSPNAPSQGQTAGSSSGPGQVQPTVRLPGHVLPVLSQTTALPIVDDGDASVSYTPAADWSTVNGFGLYGGSEHVAQTTNDAAFWTFTASQAPASITLIYSVSSAGGIAKVEIDGAVIGQIDQYAATITTQQSRTFALANLGAGSHTVETVVSGSKNAASAGTTLSVDGFIYSSQRLGDVNGDGQVTAVDALCVLRIVASLPGTVACPQPLPGNPIIATDEVQAGATTPTAVDALCILRGVAALPATAACPLITAPIASPTSVAATSTAGQAERTSRSSGPAGAVVAMSPQTVQSGGSHSTSVQVQAKALQGSLGAWTIDVGYDPKAAKVTACKANNGSICNTSFAAGVVRITGASASVLNGEQTLVTLTVEAIGTSDRASPLTVRVETLADAAGRALTSETATGTGQPGPTGGHPGSASPAQRP